MIMLRTFTFALIFALFAPLMAQEGKNAPATAPAEVNKADTIKAHKEKIKEIREMRAEKRKERAEKRKKRAEERKIRLESKRAEKAKKNVAGPK